MTIEEIRKEKVNTIFRYIRAYKSPHPEMYGVVFKYPPSQFAEVIMNELDLIDIMEAERTHEARLLTHCGESYDQD